MGQGTNGGCRCMGANGAKRARLFRNACDLPLALDELDAKDIEIVTLKAELTGLQTRIGWCSQVGACRLPPAPKEQS